MEIDEGRKSDLPVLRFLYSYIIYIFAITDIIRFMLSSAILVYVVQCYIGSCCPVLWFMLSSAILVLVVQCCIGSCCPVLYSFMLLKKKHIYIIMIIANYM